MPTKGVTFNRTTGQEAQFNLLASDCLHLMAEGGSRSSKTFGWVYALVVRALAKRSSHLAIRRYYKDCRQAIGMQTLPAVMRIAFPGVTYDINKTDWVVTFPNGSTLWLGGMDDGKRVDKCLGREYSTLFFNEASEMKYESITTFHSRLAERSGLRAKCLYDQNPSTKSHWTYKVFHLGQDPATRAENIRDWEKLYACIQINPECNKGNLADGYLETTLMGLPERQRRRFLLGEYQDDVENALWKQSTIDFYRVQDEQVPRLIRLVVAVDPSVSSTKNSHECGIVAAGKGVDGNYYVLRDESLKAHASIWGEAVVDLYNELRADSVVGEVNQGGDLVEGNLRSIAGGANIPFRAVHATRGKIRRAEPIASLYERGLVHHVGSHRFLEDEMTGYDPNQQESDENAFNRADALTWCLTELSGGSADSLTYEELLRRCVV
jgi:hypothetical protein